MHKMSFNKGTIIGLVFLAAIVGVFFLPLATLPKIIIGVVLIALFIFLRRGYIYFYKAARLLQKENSPKVWDLFKKAIDANVGGEQAVLIGSAFIQQGDSAYGVQLLEKLREKYKGKDIGNYATVTISMGYWRLGNLDKAISVLEEIKESGYVDNNLLINLTTYLLEKGDLAKAKKVIAECTKRGEETNGMLDNRGWYYIQTGEWKKASEVYNELIEERKAKFPEAYVHAAQVKIHEGDIEQAIDRLGWATSKRFTNTCAMSIEYINTLLLGLENPAKREEFSRSIDQSPCEVALGKVFPGFEKATDFDGPKPEIKKEKEAPASAPAAVAASSEDDIVSTDLTDDDDRMPNTELSDEDTKWDGPGVEDGPSSDNYEEEEEDISPVIELDEDDDREPNTDLDDED